MPTERLLTELATTLEDGRRGYAAAADALEGAADPAVVHRCRQLAAQRDRFAAELRVAAAGRGITLPDRGTAAGALHRGWIGLRDALRADDTAGVLRAVADGEAHAVASFEAVLDDDELPDDLVPLVREQTTALREARAQVDALAGV